MKLSKLIIGSLLTSALIGSASALPSNETTPSFSGSVSGTCVLDPVTFISGTNATLSSATSSSATIDFSNFADSNTAQFQSGSGIALNFAGYCNYAHVVKVKTQNGSFKYTDAANTPVPGSGDFVSALDYNVFLIWGTTLSTLDADGTANKVSPNGLVNGSFRGTGTISINLSDPAVATDPLIAGQWSDVLTLQIGQPL